MIGCRQEKMRDAEKQAGFGDICLFPVFFVCLFVR